MSIITIITMMNIKCLDLIMSTSLYFLVVEKKADFLRSLRNVTVVELQKE